MLDFIPDNTIAFPDGAIHLKVLVGGALVDFAADTFVFDKSESAEIFIGSQMEAAFDLVANVTPAATEDIFLVLGLEFMQEVNGVMYPLKNGVYNPMTLIEIDEA